MIVVNCLCCFGWGKRGSLFRDFKSAQSTEHLERL
jgi:hypothetical protein